MTGRPPADRRRADPPPKRIKGGASTPAKPSDWDRDSYRPAPETPLKTCGRAGCGAAYVDDQPSRAAHVAVFGHSPRPREQEAPPCDP